MSYKRRHARELALRAFYAFEMSGNKLDAIVKEMILDVSEESEDGKNFANKLLTLSVDRSKEFEHYIMNQAHNWDFDRIAVIDKLIMRMCICEFLCFQDIPPKVSIDEALEISKEYSTEKSSVFINGILDGVLNQLKKEGAIVKKGRGLV